MTEALEPEACPHDTNGDCGCPACSRIAQQICETLFKRQWHSYTSLMRKDGQRLCYWCGAPETKRAFVNVWGSVFNVGSCDACHLKNHGVKRDDL